MINYYCLCFKTKELGYSIEGTSKVEARRGSLKTSSMLFFDEIVSLSYRILNFPEESCSIFFTFLIFIFEDFLVIGSNVGS